MLRESREESSFVQLDWHNLSASIFEQMRDRRVPPYYVTYNLQHGNETLVHENAAEPRRKVSYQEMKRRYCLRDENLKPPYEAFITR